MGGATMTIPVTGKIAVKNSVAAEVIGLGAAYQATKELLVVADYKWINWKNTMKNFAMTFTADSTRSNAAAAGFAGAAVDATMYQNWKDQNVFMLGLGYKVSDPITVRVGGEHRQQPDSGHVLERAIPGDREEPLHGRRGIAIDKASGVDAAVIYAPEVKATAGSGRDEHAQPDQAQLMCLPVPSWLAGSMVSMTSSSTPHLLILSPRGEER